MTSVTFTVVNIRGINNVNSANSPWISSPDRVEGEVRESLRKAAPSGRIEAIHTLGELENIITHPADDSILINAHGESFPKPDKWDWEDLFDRLGNNLRDRSWTLVSLTGIPLYSYGTHERAVHQVNDAGYTGLNIVLSKADVTLSGIVSTVAMQTGEGLRAAKMVNLPLQGQQSVSRCLILKSGLPEIGFYSVGQVFGAASIRIGRGRLIYNGMMSMDFGSEPNPRSDRLLSQLGVGFLLGTLRRSDVPVYATWRVEELITTFQDNLKSMVQPSKPKGRKGETAVHKSIEDILKIKGLEYVKERQIPYSPRNSHVDFVVEECNLAIEAKLCNSKSDSTEIADQINADILVYSTRYENIVFVVYDCGFIRQPTAFKKNFERYPGVRVVIV